MSKINLVTGANGFYGSKLCEALVKKGETVVALIRKSGDTTFLKPFLHKINIHYGDISNFDEILPAFKGVDTVFHVAALAYDWGSWDLFYDTNVKGVENVMEASLRSKVNKVIHISSASVYGFIEGIEIAETSPLQPNSPFFYIASKAQGEQKAFSYHGKKLAVTILRPGTIYGANDRTITLKLLPELQKKKIPLLGGGKRLLASLYIDNLIEATLLVANKKKSDGQIYNVADKGKITWKEFFNHFCEELKCPKPTLSIPVLPVRILAIIMDAVWRFFRAKDAPFITEHRVLATANNFNLSTKKIENELGYTAKVSTAFGIKQAVKWYLQYIKEKN